MRTTKEAREMARLRWGDKLSCRLVTRQGSQLAQCQFNGVKYEGRGKTNINALQATFKKINGEK